MTRSTPPGLRPAPSHSSSTAGPETTRWAEAPEPRRLLGGDGNDSIDGNGGADTALMGAGDDTFVWDPGDGSDVVEGQDGADTMLFNGAGGAEQVDLSANGNRLRFFRTQGAITMDTAGVERVDFNALGGADLVTVNDLSGTDVTAVRVDLAGTLGGATGDGQPDRVVVNGTEGEDAITVKRRRRRCEGERPRRDGRDPPPGGRERPARDQHPRGQGQRRLRRPGRRGDPAPRRRRAPPVEPPRIGSGHVRLRPSAALKEKETMTRTIIRRASTTARVPFALAVAPWPAHARPRRRRLGGRVRRQGTVGPGFTIGLSSAARSVTSLKAGRRVPLRVNDRSSAHNFRLNGTRP